MKGQQNLMGHSKFTVLGELNSSAKIELRNKVVALNLKEIRRCRIPFHEALLIELKEDKINNAYTFFQEVINHDLENSRVLTKDKQLMLRIFTALKDAEYSSKENEIKTLLKLGKSIKDIQWLTEKIYVKALAMIRNYLT